MADSPAHPLDAHHGARSPEYLKRELAEVYLLMDHIAACEDKNLEEALQQPKGSTIGDIPIQDLCDIKFPPLNADPARAQQLRTVLIAKDRLAHAAAPATSLTIAFTYLTTAEESAWWGSRLVLSIPAIRRALAGRPDEHKRASTMVQFAIDAFPALVTRQRWLTKTVWRLMGVLMLLLLLTVITMLDLAVGQRLLATQDVLRAEATALQPQLLSAAAKVQNQFDTATAAARQQIGDAGPQIKTALDQATAMVTPVAAPPNVQAQASPGHPPPAAAPPAGRLKGAAAPPAAPAAPATLVAQKAIIDAAALLRGASATLLDASTKGLNISFCDRPKARPGATPAAGGDRLPLYDSIDQEMLCQTRADNSAHMDAVAGKLQAWNRHQWPLTGLLEPDFDDPSQKRPINDQQLAGVLKDVLNFNVLPVLLGALAATASALRNIGRKVERNTLAPRHLKLIWARVAMGAFLGAVIGLFISPSGATGLLTLAGTVPSGAGADTAIALSAPTYSFLAGFATERIFSWLDQLIGHVFSFGDPEKRPNTAKTPPRL